MSAKKLNDENEARLMKMNKEELRDTVRMLVKLKDDIIKVFSEPRRRREVNGVHTVSALDISSLSVV